MPKVKVKKADKKGGSSKKKHREENPKPPRWLWRSEVMEDLDRLMRANVKTLNELIQDVKDVREYAPNSKKPYLCILAYREMLREYREKMKPFIEIIDERD